MAKDPSTTIEAKTEDTSEAGAVVEMTIEEETAELWQEKLDGGLEFFRGEIPCMGGDDDEHGPDCSDCHGTGFHMDGEPTCAIGRGASNAAQEMENGLCDLGYFIARCLVVDEKEAAAAEWLDKIAPASRPLIEELIALAPSVARVVVLLNQIDDTQADIEESDPREMKYRELRAEAAKRIAQRDAVRAAAGDDAE